MGGHEYLHRYPVHYYDCDSRLRMTVIALLRYFEDLALLQSEDYGVGIAYYEKENVAWLLSRWDIRLHGVLRHRSEAHVLTQPMGMRRFLANRRYVVHDAEGALVAEAESQWVYLDTARKRPARIPEEIFRRYGVEGDLESLPTPQAPATVERVDEEREFSVRMSDIDSNGHVNNIRYVEWALEALPADIVRDGTLRRLLVHYRKEVRYGTDVAARSMITRESGTAVVRHEILEGDAVACAMETHWDVGEGE
jgi:medium-chain acyl-[acyl-carrier-protein] hydrolase